MPPLRIGVLGLGRGLQLATAGSDLLELTAVCEADPTRLGALAGLECERFERFEAMLGSGIEAVIVANHFHQHARFAIAALQAGVHVLSETAACFTPAEGVALLDASEASSAHYLLAENYAFLPFVETIAKLYDRGELGKAQYVEADYVHPISAKLFRSLAPGADHWRNWLPMIYYCSHSLAPVLRITGERVLEVSGVHVPIDPKDAALSDTSRRGEPAGVLTLRLSGGTVVRLLQGTLRGEHVGVRVHGSRAAAENLRHDRDTVRVRVEEWDSPDGLAHDELIRAESAGGDEHGGTDRAVVAHFVDVVDGALPLVDVYQAVEMAMVGIVGHRSASGDGRFMAIPDLRDRHARDAWRNDDFSPAPR